MEEGKLLISVDQDSDDEHGVKNLQLVHFVAIVNCYIKLFLYPLKHLKKFTNNFELQN